MSIAFVYPGQGSQSVGMGKFLYENFSEAKTIFEESSDAISKDLKKLCFEGPESELMKTENTQPAIVAVSIATTLVLKNEFGIEPTVSAGHSVGEYAAAFSAGCISSFDAVKAVRFRGQYMQEAVPEGLGAMAAFMGPDSQDVIDICKWVSNHSDQGILEAANFNAPGQIVISGHASALKWLEDNLKNYPWAKTRSEDSIPKRMKLIPLKVSAPFHCSLMNPAQEKMKQYLSHVSFQNPGCLFVQNVTASVTKDALQVKENLVKQISHSVRWIECVENIKKQNIEKIIEVGSGQVLKGLNKKIWPEFENFKTSSSIDDLKTLN